MNLYDILSVKFPNANFTDDIKLQDDGQGAYIKEWNINDPIPSQDDIAQWGVDLEDQYQFRQNRIGNKSIYDQLVQIDLKSIRALREGDTIRLAELENQASLLRAQLLPEE